MLTPNLDLIGVIPSDAKGNMLSVIYAGEPIYVTATFTTQGLPSNVAPYRLRAMTPDAFAIPLYSPFITKGAGAIGIPTYTETWGTIIPYGGPEMISVFINPDISFTETTLADNALSFEIDAISQPTHLYETTPPPSTIQAGVPFSLDVSVLDAFSNTVLDDNSPIAINLASGAPAGSAITGFTTVQESNGVAHFAGLTLNKVTTVSGLTFDFTSADNQINGSELFGVSGSINVTPGTASQLMVTQQPNPTTTAGGYIGVFKVSVEDQFGNVETADNMTQVGASMPAGDGPLMGANIATARQGVATFSAMIDDKAEVAPIDLASGILTPAATNNITILPGLTTQLILQGQPSSTGTVGLPFAVQPVIEEEDRYGNLETGDFTSRVTASPSTGVGPLVGSSAVVSGGVATFTGLADEKAETLSLKFASSPLATGPSTNIVVGKATPTISWAPAPLAITSGLEPAQLDAVAKVGNAVVPGTYAYSLPPGTILSLGMHPLAVTFTPTDLSDYTTATGSATVNVLRGATASLTIPVSMINYKQSVTFSVGVVPAAGGSTPTGSVAFVDGSTVVGSAKLGGNGRATFTTNSLPPSTRSIVAVYSGDSTYAPSTSLAAPLRVKTPTVGDFDGDGKADVAIYDPTNATFYVLGSSGAVIVQPFGNPADKNIPVIGDFDGDGKTDIAIYDQTTATFFALKSGGGVIVQPFGNPSDKNIPIAGDFDGDGKTDIAIYDQTTATFFALESGGGVIIQALGAATHANLPVAGDFDGDGKTDLAIYDQTAATFFILESGGGTIVKALGAVTHVNVPLASDYDGDGKTDLAIYDQTIGMLYALESGGATIAQPFGNPADGNIPLALDFDGDGRTDTGVYDQAAGEFLVLESGGGSIVLPFGNKKHANLMA